MQSPNNNRSVVSGQTRSLVGLESTTQQSAPVSGSTIAGERSGSRALQDRTFRRVTLVGPQTSSLRRSGGLSRPE